MYYVRRRAAIHFFHYKQTRRGFLKLWKFTSVETSRKIHTPNKKRCVYNFHKDASHEKMGVLLWKDLQLSFGLGSNSCRSFLASNRRCKKGLRTRGRWLWPLGGLTWRELPVQVEDFRTSTTGHHHEKSSANDTDRVLKNEAAECQHLVFFYASIRRKRNRFKTELGLLYSMPLSAEWRSR